MKKKIVIAEYISTGVNYVYDILSLGYEPILLDCPYVAGEEETNHFRGARKTAQAKIPKGLTLIE